MKYTILLGKSKFALESKVNAALKDGWAVAGGVAINDSYFYQAMTKFEIGCPVKVQMATERGWIDVGEIA